MKTMLALIAGFILGAFSMYVWQSQNVATASTMGQAPVKLPVADTTIAATPTITANTDETQAAAAPTTSSTTMGSEGVSSTGSAANPPAKLPVTSFGSATLDEMMQLHQAQIADWQKPYWASPRDESDARVAEDKLQYRLFSNQTAQAHPAKSISCRAELCRIEFSFADLPAMVAFNRAWDGSALDGSHSVWSSGFADASGSASFIIYAVRNESFP